jgi:predicted nucleic acid-binding protein
MHFLDSSALVKVYRQEQGTERVISLVTGSETLVIARFAIVEVSAALVRRGRQALVPSADIALVLAQLDQDAADVFQVI